MTKQIDTSELSHTNETGMHYTVCCAPVLHLTLKKYWFDMIKSGVKKEEYREIKDYWIKRLFRFPEIFECLKNSCIECKFRIDIENMPACSFDNKHKTECDNYKFKWTDRYFNTLLKNSCFQMMKWLEFTVASKLLHNGWRYAVVAVYRTCRNLI